jgi:tetratricopeptide (TPR) repeat protein
MPSLSPQRLEASAGLLLWASLIAAFFIYAPGLSAFFTFDDFANLGRLGDIGRDPSLYQALQFIADGKAGPLGRPLATATFAAQHASWPNHAGDFLYVNLLLHLLNATLLFWFLLRLLPLLGESRARTLAIAGAVSWLWVMAAPQVSTVLYAVQRMAILAGTCQLAGLLLYVAGRQHALAGRDVTGVMLMCAGVVTGLGFGVLAKESAATFPLLPLALEATLLRALPRSRLWRAASLVLIAAPALLLLGYLLLKLPVWIEGAQAREFTFGERLLTQTRVLFMYLGRILIPSFAGARLLYDDLAASTSLIHPWTTATSSAAWIALAVLAWRWRHRWPMLAFALLWFIGAQLLESSVIPLELAFEHRSYVAMIGPLLALADGVRRLLDWPAARRLRPALAGAALLYLAVAPLAAHVCADLWGRPLQQAYVWVERQPHSLRARFQLAAVLDIYRRPDEAARVYHAALEIWPDDPNLLLPLFMQCDPQVSVEQVERGIRSARRDLATTMLTLTHAADSLKEAGCGRTRAADLRRLTEVAVASPFLSRDRCSTLGVRISAEEAQGNRPAAREALDEYVRHCPRVGAIQQAVFWAVQDHDLERAKAYLEIAETSPLISRLHRWAYRKEIAGTRQLIAIVQEAQENPLP